MTKCLMCGTEFVPSKFNASRQKFCSPVCRWNTWANNNPSDVKKHRKNYKTSHKNQVLAYQKEWVKKDRLKKPEYYRMKVRNRKALIRLTSGSSKTFSTKLTVEDWIEIQKLYGNKCRCGFTGKLTIDHIIPLSKGGIHAKENIQPLCHSCNSRKKDKIDSVPCIRHTVIENPTSNMSVVGTS